jgi:hypothetical protein
MEEINLKATLILCAIVVTVIAVIANDCRVCDIMQNPPDWIDSWYDGPDRWNLPEKGPAE